MKLADLQNKKILVVGRGIEGTSAIRFLNRFAPGAIIDTADATDGPEYLKKQIGFDYAIRSPGVPKRFITIPHTTPTNIFFGNTRGIVIGITGAKGKSTTASLVYEMMREAGLRVTLIGNIGNPMLDALTEELSHPQKPPFYYVAELSSYQLDDIAYSPHISVIINFHPDHMDYHEGVEPYWKAKQNILSQAQPDDYYIFNESFPPLVELSKKTRARLMPFVKSLPFSDDAIPLLGSHNRDNARAAATVARLIGISDPIIERAVRNFRPLPHRLEYVGTFRGIPFYDDAISTTPESTIKAIEAIPKIGTIFLGGKNRGYNFEKLAETLIRFNIPNIVLFPESGAAILEALKTRAKKLPNILETTRMEDAVRFAYAHTPSGNACILSTASPSYSLWKNFEEKGDEFQKLVKKFGH